MTNFLNQRGKRHVSAALFDFDGTFVDSLDVHMDSHFAVLASVDAVRDRQEVEKASSEVNFNTDTLYRKFGNRLDIDHEQLITAHVADMHERYVAHVFTSLPGAKELLDLITQSELSVAVVTSSSLSLAEIALQTSGLRGFVDVIVSRVQTSLHKPCPKPYLHALGNLRISKDNAVVFEDSRDGLIAALHAGIFTFYLGEAPTENETSIPPLITSALIH